MIFNGKAITFKDNIDTDVIIPARYLNISDMKQLSAHCMEDIDPDFLNKIDDGDIIVAGKNFGCGSSREHAPAVIKSTKISCVIAKSFARIFYRNAINIGLVIIECEQACNDAQNQDEIEVNLDEGIIFNKTKNKTYKFRAFPEFIQEIIKSGGLAGYVKEGKIDEI